MRTRSGHCCRGFGFSLVELVVVIAIVGILATIAAVALGRTRDRAKRAHSLSNLRAHAQVFSSYDSDWAALPAPIAPGQFTTWLSAQGRGFGPFSYFDTCEAWPIALSDGYYSQRPDADVFYPPSTRLEAESHAQPYLYPCCFLTTPAYWNPYTRRGLTQYQPVGLSDVRYASAKVLIVEPPDASRDPHGVLQAAFSDCSARATDAFDRNPGYDRGDGYLFEEHGAVHFTDSPLLLHTLDGAWGRDVR